MRRWNVFNPYCSPLAAHVWLESQDSQKALAALADIDLVSLDGSYTASAYGDRISVSHVTFGEVYVLLRSGVNP